MSNTHSGRDGHYLRGKTVWQSAARCPQCGVRMNSDGARYWCPVKNCSFEWRQAEEIELIRDHYEKD